MTKNSNPETPGCRGFLPQDTLSLADVLRRVTEDEEVLLRRRREIASSLRKLAGMIERPLDRVPADPGWLRGRLKRLTAATGGVSEARFRNIKSDLRAALKCAGITAHQRLAPLTSNWLALFGAADERTRWVLSRLAHFASANQLVPEDIDDNVINAMHRALLDEGLLKDPDQIVRNTIRRWNLAVDRVPSWPPNRLTPPQPKRPPWTLPLDQFPERMQREVAQWEARLLNTDPLVTDGPPRPLSPNTVKYRVFYVRMVASALVHVGHPIGRIDSLAYLVELQNFRDAIGFMLDRYGGPRESVHNVAVCLKAIARHVVKLPEDRIAELAEICRRLDQEADGIRERNRERLLQLDDDDNLAALLHLPAELVEKAAKMDNRDPREAARLVQRALAIEILLHTGLRIGNLASLNIDEHLRWMRSRDEDVIHVVIPRSQVKNRTPLHHELRGATADLVDLYIERYRPRLTEPGNPWLFPGRFGGHRSPGGFSQQIKATILRHAGVEVNAHLFRHIAGKIHLRVEPGDHVTIAHVLDDTLATVMSTYSIFEKPRSLRHYQNSLFKLRAELNRPRRVRRPRRKAG